MRSYARNHGLRKCRAGFFAMISIAALLAAGCDREATPTGQVIAVIDGEELTTAELNYEARTRGLQIGSDRGMRDALLRELIDRKLLAQAAVARGADRSPDHLLALRRLSEIALGQRLLEDAASASAQASPAEVERYIAANPKAFGARVTYVVDAITIAAQLPPELRQALAAAPSVDAMEKIASGAGFTPRRSSEMWDSAMLADDAYALLQAKRPNDNFVLTPAAGTHAGRLTTIVAQPVPVQQRVPLAQSLIRRTANDKTLRASVEEARAKAVIRYQPGFAPGDTPSP